MTWVEFHVDARVAVITLANPSLGNVLNLESLQELGSALMSAIADSQARVIVLRSRGEPFCLGLDLALVQAAGRDPALAKTAMARYIALLTGIHAAPKPVVCLVRGAVTGGGLGLVGVCDIVLASERATFEFSEVILGLIPASVMPFLYSLRLAPQKLNYLILSAKRMTAAEAWRLNLVDEVFADSTLAAEAKAVIKGLFRASPHALAETKRFARLIDGKPLDQACRLAQDKLAELISRPEVLNAIRDFNDGRSPEWFAKYQPDHSLVPEDLP